MEQTPTIKSSRLRNVMDDEVCFCIFFLPYIYSGDQGTTTTHPVKAVALEVIVCHQDHLEMTNV